jgi:hypothetical protein
MNLTSSRVEAGSNTSTVSLRVVGGDEKGSLESETVKYGHESNGTLTRKLLCWRGPGATATVEDNIHKTWGGKDLKINVRDKCLSL